LGENGLRQGTDLPGLGTVAACPFIGAGVVARNRRGGVFGYGGGGASCYGRQFALKADSNGVASSLLRLTPMVLPYGLTKPNLATC
jgi:hypothetical protein